MNLNNLEKMLEDSDVDWKDDVLEQLKIWKDHYQTDDSFSYLFCNMTLIWTRNGFLKILFKNSLDAKYRHMYSKILV